MVKMIINYCNCGSPIFRHYIYVYICVYNAKIIIIYYYHVYNY